MKVASSQFNYRYGDQTHYPYSIGSLLAYAVTKRDDLEILPCAIHRDRLSDYIERAATADVLLCSAYVWNWEITNTLAKEAKARNPRLRVIFGGPQVPDRMEGFFDAHPYIDSVVHGEGEAAFVEMLANPTRENLPTRLSSLDDLPSPYTTGIIDLLIADAYQGKWVASWETNRGCPYQCTFCDWGSATYTKLRQYPIGRLEHEIRWFAERQIGYIDCCDANFGMMPRDLDLATKLKEVAISTGWPQTFRQSWAKNSSEKVIDVAKQLRDGKMLTAVGLALQSLDTNTLQIIKRKNLPFDRLASLSQQFADHGLPTYTEIIRGLPGETLESFKNGLATLVADANIGTIYIYHCGILPNAPLADPAYRRQHRIEGVRSPIYLAHSSIHQRDVPEFEQIVTSTATMSREDMQEAFMYSWIVMVGESLGMLSHLRAMSSLSAREFYDTILQRSRDGFYAFGEEYRRVEEFARNGYAGNGWNHHDPKLGDIYWPIEEASWLRLAENPCLELEIGRVVDAPYSDLHDQVAMLSRRPAGTPMWEWARDTIWYGRRRGRFLKSEL